MTIYTDRGDEGQTDLRTMDRVSKANPRIEAYGTVDEVNATVGRVRPTGHEDVDEQLRPIQNHLHVVQADLANPEPDDDDPRMTHERVTQLEGWMDAHDEELDPSSRSSFQEVATAARASITPERSAGGPNAARLRSRVRKKSTSRP